MARHDLRKRHATRFVEHIVGQDDAARKRLRWSLSCARICEAPKNYPTVGGTKVLVRGPVFPPVAGELRSQRRQIDLWLPQRIARVMSAHGSNELDEIPFDE